MLWHQLTVSCKLIIYLVYFLFFIELNNDDYLIEALQKLKSITANNCKLLDTGDTDIVYDNVLAEHEEVDKQYQPLMFNDSNIEAVAICSSDSECSDFDKETVVNFSNDSNDLSQRDVELNDDMCNMEINIENYDSTTPSANCNKENEVDISEFVKCTLKSNHITF